MLSLSLHALGHSEHNPIRYILQRLGCRESGVSILVFDLQKYIVRDFLGSKFSLNRWRQLCRINSLHCLNYLHCFQYLQCLHCLTLLRLLTLRDCLHSGIYICIHKVAVRRPYKTTQRDLISKSQNTVGWDRWDNMPQTATTTKAQVVLITCVAFAPELVLSWSTCLMLYLKFYFILPLSKFNFR